MALNEILIQGVPQTAKFKHDIRCLSRLIKHSDRVLFPVTLSCAVTALHQTCQNFRTINYSMAGGPLAGKVCLVTGATRGIGKGIALHLGQAGATVYVTGRTLKPTSGRVGGSLEETAEEITKRGGRCIPVVCDHGDMEDVEKLFEQIKREQDGRLDVLVNNAYSAVTKIMESYGTKFWDQSPTMWDDVNNVGLRNHFYCSVFAARMMVPRRQGLIINVSSAGGLRYLFNIPYGVGKEALDRMSVDCAIELKKEKVACVSLWPGAVITEEIKAGIEDSSNKAAQLFAEGESPEFVGICVVKLAQDENILSSTGRILTTADLSDQYDICDIDGSKPNNLRSIRTLLAFTGHTWAASMFPRWLRIPRWLLALAGNKF